MKIISKLGKVLFWLLILVLLAAPLGLIFEISNREKLQYAAPTAPAFVEMAYGRVAEAERMDMRECVLVSGTFRSRTYEYMELKQTEPSKIRWDISVGDEIQEGQILGTYKGENVTAPISGLVAEINTFDGYLKIQLASPVLLECDVSPKVLAFLKYAQDLTTEAGEAVTLVYTAMIRNSDGTTHVRLRINSEDYFLDQTVEDLLLYTGNVYTQALVLPEACVYQRTAGEDEPWYARQVTEGGRLIGEVEVSRGYSDGEWVSVTGIEEGQFFDTGYKQIAEEG